MNTACTASNMYDEQKRGLIDMDKLYYNGQIITMRYRSEQEELDHAADAVLVSDGIIQDVGAFSDIKASVGTDVQLIDLDGTCLMPSFIDPHGHFVMNSQMALCPNLSDCESFADIIQVLKNFMKENHLTEDDALIGFGYDHNFLKEHAQPDKRVLDQVSATNPIMILHVSGHLACANSRALALANIDSQTPNPFGGVIGRLEDGKEPSGYLEEAAMMALQNALRDVIKMDPKKMMASMQQCYLENGITTVQDGASSFQDIKMLQTMSQNNFLSLDVVAYPLITDDGDAIMKELGRTYKDYVNHLKIGGYKLILDGSPQGRSAWMSEPYLGDDKEYCGYPWLNDDIVNSMCKKAVKEGKQLLCHCNGDAASEQFLHAYEQAVKEIGNDQSLRPTMIHCQTVRNDQLDRMANLSMIASIFVGHVWYWGDIHMSNFGDIRGHHISPVKDAMDRGIIVNFHQDAPVTRPNMLHSIWCALNRISRSGRIIGEDQKIPVYDALKAATIHGAYQYFEEDQKGSIAKGKRADLIILDQSPLHVDPIKIKDITVLETIKDGQTIYRK